MTAYTPSEWTDLFVSTAGASAALAGLVFVAISINVERILKFKGLPERALETVLMLLSIVLVSIVALMPAQSSTALGAELLALGLVFGGVITVLAMRSLPSHASRPPGWLLLRVLLIAAGTAPVIVGGASLLAETGGGLYWVAAGIVFAIAGSVANAWVLMIEILR